MTVPEDESLRPMSPGEVAELFAVSTKTVFRWANEGKIPSFKTVGGHRRFPRREILDLAVNSMKVNKDDVVD